MKTGVGSFLILLCAVIAGCDTGPMDRVSLQITTRGGGNFLVVDAKANYAAACGPGEVDLFSLQDLVGLRPLSGASSAEPDKIEEILWKDITGVDFGAPSGNIGDFCEGMPVSLAATVHYKDGTQQKRALQDTTDEGIEGKTERGDIIIPLREIAKLSLVKDEHWPWSYDRSDVNYITRLHVTDRDGHAVDFPEFRVNTSYTKQKGDEYLQVPYGSDEPHGLPVAIAGARLDLPWRLLKSADFLPFELNKDVKARVTFADGHTEELTIRRGSIDSPLLENVEQQSVPFNSMSHFDAQTHTEPVPKPLS